MIPESVGQVVGKDGADVLVFNTGQSRMRYAVLHTPVSTGPSIFIRMPVRVYATLYLHAQYSADTAMLIRITVLVCATPLLCTQVGTASTVGICILLIWVWCYQGYGGS